MWPDLETIARFKGQATNTLRAPYHNRQPAAQCSPRLIPLINAKQLDTEGRRGSLVDGVEAGVVPRQSGYHARMTEAVTPKTFDI